LRAGAMASRGGGGLVVATWGYFWGWREQEYVAECGGEVRVKSRTTMPLSARSLECLGASSVSALILVPSSALPEEAVDAAAGCGDCRGVLGGLWREALSAAESLALEGSGGGYRVEAVVAPSSGAFRLARRGAGGASMLVEVREESGLRPAEAYRGRVLLEAALRLVEGGYGFVAFDSTHGINYYIVAAARAAPAAAEASAALHLSRVRYLVFNSDPVFPVGVKSAWLRVAEESFFDGVEALGSSAAAVAEAYAARGEKLFSPDSIVKARPDVARSVKPRIAPARRGYESRYALPAAAATLYALPLAALQTAALYAAELTGAPPREPGAVAEAHRLHRQYMARVLASAREAVDPLENPEAYAAEGGGGGLRISHLAAVDPLALEAWLRSHAVLGGLLKSLASALEGAHGEVTVETVEGLPLVEASINALQSVTETLFRSPNKIATRQELSRIKDRRSELKPGAPPAATCKPDHRNFAAHAGLESRVTELKDRGGLLMARYRPCYIRGDDGETLSDTLKRLLGKTA